MSLVCGKFRVTATRRNARILVQINFRSFILLGKLKLVGDSKLHLRLLDWKGIAFAWRTGLGRILFSPSPTDRATLWREIPSEDRERPESGMKEERS